MLVPLSEIEVVALRVVNFPVEAVVAPIGVLSIDPPVAVRVPAVIAFEAEERVKALE